MRIQCIALSLLLIFCGCICCEKAVLLDSFEGDISNETVDFGSSEGTVVTVTASSDFKKCGEQSLKVEYDLKTSGYMWIARGYNLDVKGAAQWLLPPQEITWEKFNAISVYMYGTGSGAVIAFDIKDANGEMWRYLLDDDTQGWREIICPFDGFFARKDWQPDAAQKDDVLDFPLMSFQFEPRLPGKGVYYFDCVTLKRVAR